MKHRALSFAVVVSFELIGSFAQAQDMSDARRDHECSALLESSFAVYSADIPGIITRGDSESNISIIANLVSHGSTSDVTYNFVTNFSDLLSQYKSYDGRISTIASNKDEPLSDDAAFLNWLSALGSEVTNIQYSASKAEGEFLRLAADLYLPNLSRVLSTLNANIQKQTALKCQDFGTIEPALTMKNDLNSWWIQVNQAKSLIAEVQSKRNILLEQIRSILTTRMEEGYSQKTIQNLITVKNMVLKGLVINDFHTEFEFWWNFKYSGMDNFWSSRYLNLHKAREVLIQRLAEGNQFLEKWQSLRGIDDSIVLNQIEIAKFRINLIQGWKDKIEQMGWSSFFRTQQEIVTRDLQYLERIPKICEAILKNYQAIVPSVISFDTFAEAERRYMRIAQICNKRETEATLTEYNTKVSNIGGIYRSIIGREPLQSELLEGLMMLENGGYHDIETKVDSLAWGAF